MPHCCPIYLSRQDIHPAVLDFGFVCPHNCPQQDAKNMRIAFVFIAEAYQCYHLAAVALELREREGVSVDVFYNDPETPHYLDRICAAYGVPPLKARRLRRDWRAWFIQLPKLLGLAKKQVLQANCSELMTFDIVVSPERILSELHREAAICGTVLAYLPHGAGDRQVAAETKAADFDLVLLPGDKDARRYLKMGYIRPGHCRVVGFPKLETVQRVQQANPGFFKSARPTVLYNPHRIRSQSSWRACIEPILADFAKQDEFNLIVAPHVKLFHRRGERVRNRWRSRSTPHILIDPGSERCMDNSYTEAADIYVGDVSSQVCEFLLRPRPCVFLNPHRLSWRDNPYFRFWTLGEVIEDVKDLLPALRRATALHPQFMEKQLAYRDECFGEIREGASRYAADSLLEFARNGMIDP
jgi:hypothetical protein